jgi:hypothetical protein
MVTLAARIELLECGKGPLVSNLAQCVNSMISFAERVSIGLHKSEKSFHLVSRKLFRDASGELVRIRLEPPNKPGKATVQERDDSERKNRPPPSKPANPSRPPGLPLTTACVVHDPSVSLGRPNARASPAALPFRVAPSGACAVSHQLG